jgi:hypothetical protein
MNLNEAKNLRYWSENYKRTEEKAHLWIDYKTGKMTYTQYDKRIAKFLK